MPASVALFPLTVYVASSPATVTPVTDCVCSVPLYVRSPPNVTTALPMAYGDIVTDTAFVTGM